MTDLPAVVYLTCQTSIKKPSDTYAKEGNNYEKHLVKKFKSEHGSNRSQIKLKSYKKLLEALNNVIVKKLDKIDQKLDYLSNNCDILEENINKLSSYFDISNAGYQEIIVRVSEENDIVENTIPSIPASSKDTYVSLNTEVDFPDGSWLGFENNPEMRVRCTISPVDLEEINCKYATPEKMALILLDNLFDRETQACSNISGMGKHKKKQLNPLFIYGIKCHLIYRFDINEDDWTKIKNHIDSKCRTAFRRKLKGMTLTPKTGYKF